MYLKQASPVNVHRTDVEAKHILQFKWQKYEHIISKANCHVLITTWQLVLVRQLASVYLIGLGKIEHINVLQCLF